MGDAVKWLRISYWVGAVVDGVAAVQMLHPPLFAFGMGFRVFHPGADYRYAVLQDRQQHHLRLLLGNEVLAGRHLRSPDLPVGAGADAFGDPGAPEGRAR